MESDNSLVRIGTKRKAGDVPMDVSAPRRLKTTHDDVANKITGVYEKIATTFPRFGELPQELQIQCWEHAIKDTIGDDIKATNFGIYLITTERMMAHRIGAYQYNYMTGPGGKTILLVPKFINIMAVSNLPRLIACKWWKSIMENCVVEVDYLDSIKVTLVTEIGRLIEDVSENEEGGEGAEASQ